MPPYILDDAEDDGDGSQSNSAAALPGAVVGEGNWILHGVGQGGSGRSQKFRSKTVSPPMPSGNAHRILRNSSAAGGHPHPILIGQSSRASDLRRKIEQATDDASTDPGLMGTGQFAPGSLGSAGHVMGFKRHGQSQPSAELQVIGQHRDTASHLKSSVNPNSYRDGITRLVTSHLFDQAKKHDCLIFIRTTGAYPAITFEHGVGAGKPLSVKAKSSTATFTPGSIVFLARLAKWVESSKPKDPDAVLKEQIDLLAATGDPAHGAPSTETRGQFAWMPKLHSLASLKRLPSLKDYKGTADENVTANELRYSEKDNKAVPTDILYRVKKVDNPTELNSYTPKDAKNRAGDWDTLPGSAYPVFSASKSDQKKGEALYQIFIHKNSLQQDDRLKELWEAKEADPNTWPLLGKLADNKGAGYLKLATRAREYLYAEDAQGYVPIFVLGEIMSMNDNPCIKETVADYDMLAVCPSIDSLREALLKEGTETSAFARLKHFLPGYDHDQGILSAKEKEIVGAFDSEFGADDQKRSALSTRHGCEVNNLFFTVDLDFPKLMLIRPLHLPVQKNAVIVDKLLYWYALAQYQSDEAGAGREKQVRADLGRGEAFRLSELFVFPINLAWGKFTIGATQSDFSAQIGSNLRPEVANGVELLDNSLSQQYLRVMTCMESEICRGSKRPIRQVKPQAADYKVAGEQAWRMAVRLLFLRCHFEAVKCAVAEGFLKDPDPTKVAWRMTENEKEAKGGNIHPAYHGYEAWSKQAIKVVEQYFPLLDTLMEKLPQDSGTLCQDLPKLREYMKPVINKRAEDISAVFGPTPEWPKCPVVDHAD